MSSTLSDEDDPDLKCCGNIVVGFVEEISIDGCPYLARIDSGGISNV